MRNSLMQIFWRLFYSRLRPPPADLTPGYSVLLLVPGDLPVFRRIAMDVCAKQDQTHLEELLVIPDQVSPALEAQWDSIERDWPGKSIRLVRFNAVDRWLVNQAKNPHVSVWLQMVRGIEAARTTHAIWHDADLFITDPNMMRQLYEHAAANNMACWGIDPQSPIFMDWFHSRGIKHIVASYEMMMDVKWFRSFKPWEHRRSVTVNGETHGGDITYYSQVNSPPERFGWKRRPDDFVHFSYVISTYRWFQQALARGDSFPDKRFTVLLARLLIDAYDHSDWPYEVPHLDVIARGINDPSQPVTFMDEENTQRYPEFRQIFDNLLNCDLLDEHQKAPLREGIKPFDAAFER
ncbi:MAG: hypothetical protein CMJ49_00665 [Planctomycetaceae bacterium]|nr:hypothetical protein [Planctomycetaceae bacterium]